MAIEGGIFLDILARLNMASVDRVMKDVQTMMKEAGTTSGDAFTESLDRSISAGAKAAFDPLLEASNAAFRDMQIGMADLQSAEARINDLRARSFKSTTDQMIAAQANLDKAIANSQKLMADASKTNAAYRDSFIAAPALGERGTPDERTPSTGNNREVATRGESGGMGDFAAGAATGAGAEVVAENKGISQTQDLTREVLSHRIAGHLEEGGRRLFNVAGIGAALGLTGAVSYGVRSSGRIQDNLAQLQSLHGESAADLAAITPAIWRQAIQTGFNTNDISKLYPNVEKAKNPLTGGNYRGNEAIGIVGTALQLARVTGISPEEAMQGLTTSLYNYKTGPSGANGMANLISQGLAGFKGNAADYFSAQHTIEPVAEMAGIRAPEAFGLLDIASQTGQTAQQTGDSARNLIRSLAAPNSMVSQAMQQFGLNPQDVSVYLNQNGIAGTLGMVAKAIASHQTGPNGSVVLGALANKPLLEEQQKQIANQLSPAARQYMESDDFQKSLVSGFKARSILEKAGSENFTTSDMPLLQTWLADQQKLMGVSDVLRRNQPMVQNLYGAYKSMFGTQDAGQLAIMAGGSPEALAAYQKQTSALAGAQNNPNAFVKSFNEAMSPAAQQWHSLEQSLGSLSARIGDDLLPVITTVIDKFKGILDYLEQHKRAESDLIDAMVAMTGLWAANKLKLTKLISMPIKAGYNAFKNRGGGGSEVGDGTLQSAADTLESASTTFETASTTFETGATTFETATSAFAEAVPIFGEAVPIFGEAVPIFSEAATTFSTAVAPFETGATAFETAGTSMETASTQLETAATSLDTAATALDGAASALDGAAAAGGLDRNLPGVVPGGGEEPEVSPGDKSIFGKFGSVIPGFIPLPQLPQAQQDWLKNHPGGKLSDMPGLSPQDKAKLSTPSPLAGPGTHPDLPGPIESHAYGGITGQPLMGVPDMGYDSVLGMLPSGQPVGLRGGEGILTPEAVQALGGEAGINAINQNPWSNPMKVATTFYSSFAKGVAKYSPYGKYLEANSQGLTDLEREHEKAAKLQQRQTRDLADYMINFYSDQYGAAGDTYAGPSLRTIMNNPGKYWYDPDTGAYHSTRSAIKGGSPEVMSAILNAAQSMGLDQRQYDDVKWIFSHESGFDPTISNGGGHGAPSNSRAYGLGQFLGHMGDKYGQMGAYSGDPGAETRAAIQYMIDKYGSPAAAKAYWLAHGSYSKGGVVKGYAGGGVVGGGGILSPGIGGGPLPGNFGGGGPFDPLSTPQGPYMLGIRPGLIMDDQGRYLSPWGAPWPKGWEADPSLAPARSSNWGYPQDPDAMRSYPGNDVMDNGDMWPDWNDVMQHPPGGMNMAAYHFALGGIIPTDITPTTTTPPPPPPPPGAQGGGYGASPNINGTAPPPNDPSLAGPDGQGNYGTYGTNMLPGMPGMAKPGRPRKAKKPPGPLHNGPQKNIYGNIPNAYKIPGGTQPSGDRNAKQNPSQQLTAEGKGFGVQGGLIGGLESAAGTAADMFAPGSGQGAQMLFALANRAIGFGGQLFGIGMEGLMETFLPNDSPGADPSKNIFGKMALGIAGAHPSGTNMAGSHAKSLTPKKNLDAGAMQAKQMPGIHVHGDIHNHTGDHKETFNAINKAVNFANHAGTFAGQ